MKEQSETIPPSMTDTAICTLFEGDFHLGLAAFLNSLAHAGFAGTVWAGYRGALPPWIGQLKADPSQTGGYWVSGQMRVVFLRQNTEIHLTNFKPDFMLGLLANEARDAKYLWYFDPDIFVRVEWPFFADWQSNGIALCQEIANNNLPPDTPQRMTWMRDAASIGFRDPKPLYHYFNGGLTGVPRECAEFLEDWKRLIAMAAAKHCDLKDMSHGSMEAPYNCCDQDALNIAAMYTKFPLSTLGPQGMGFVRGIVIMYHTVGAKPWRGSFLLSALKGIPPSDGFKFYLTQVESPIRPYSGGRLAAKKLACKIAALIGRFYRRS